MNLTSQVKGLISEVEGSLSLDNLSEKSIEAKNTLGKLKGRISPKKYEKLELSLNLAEIKGEDNCFSGYYH